MRFGGHETFAVREGWLHKGLKLLIQDPDKLIDEYSADWLGVGRNMANSIRHWLVATGLAEKTGRGRNRKMSPLRETELGRLIHERDPYFLARGTWWALHVNLVHSADNALSWHWYFNHFHLTRFEKPVCVESLRRHLELSRVRMPSIKTLERDLGCLLATYAKTIPSEKRDPEEATDSPFQELGLLRHFRSSGYYEVDDGEKMIPPHVLGYALSKCLRPASTGDDMLDVPLLEAARMTNGPGRVFRLSAEALFDAFVRAESALSEATLHIAGLAGERVVRIRALDPLDWIREYFDDLEERDRDAA